MNAFRIHYGEDPNQFGDLRRPPHVGARPLLISIHGGYWRARWDCSHMNPLCESFSKAGWLTWNVEYRRVGNPGGGWPGTIEDLETALAFARAHAQEWNADLARAAVAGFSAGGHLALCLAARQPWFRAVFSLGGVVDLQQAWDLNLSEGAVREFLGGPPSEHPDADPMQLRICDVKQRLIHGTKDESVPVELSRQYAIAKQRRGEDCTFLEFQDAGHFDLIDPESAVWPFVVMDVEEAVDG